MSGIKSYWCLFIRDNNTGKMMSIYQSSTFYYFNHAWAVEIANMWNGTLENWNRLTKEEYETSTHYIQNKNKTITTR